MDISQIRKALTFLSTEMDKIAGKPAGGEGKIGLRQIEDSRGTMLWVGRGEGVNVNDCWYILDEQKVAHYQAQNAVTGILTGLSLRVSKGGKEDLTKLSFWMQAGLEKYRIESGLETVFTRGVLLGLNSIPHEDTGSLLSIGVKPSDKMSGTAGNVVYGEVYDAADQRVVCEYDKTILSKDLLEIVAAHFEIKVTTKGEDTAAQPQSPPPPTVETYEVKGLKMSKEDALKHYYAQLKVQADRLNLDKKQTYEKIRVLTNGKGLKESTVQEVAQLLKAFQDTPAPITHPAEQWNEDVIPF
jgi:hypothetical protein